MNPALNYLSAEAFEQAMAFYEHAIATWPMPAEPRNVTTRFGHTFVLSWGAPDGPPLILLHGSAANSSTWAFDAATLGASFRVLAVDLPGETGKSTGYRPPYGASAYPDWLSDVLDELGLGSAPIAGLSLGGWVALKFAAAYAARVEKLVLLARRLVSALFAPHSPPPGVAEAFVFMHSIYKTRRDTLPVLTDEELDRIAVPALLLGGAQDAVLDIPATDARLRRHLGRYESEIDPHGGHAFVGKGAKLVEFLRRAG
jgi:pimeloyl-ACP methyl ester carboxylesterase